MSKTWIDKEMAKAIGNNLNYLHTITFDPQEIRTTEEIGNFIWQYILSLKTELQNKSDNESLTENLKRIKHVHTQYKEMERKRVEDKALKIHEEQTEIQRKLRQGLYPSEIVLSKVVKLLQDGRWKHTTEIKDFNNLLLRQIDDWEKEITNNEK